MLVFLFLLVLLAIAGLLGVVLKAVVVIVASVVLATLVVGWLGWRAVKRHVARSNYELTVRRTDVRVGEISRTPPDDAPPAVDERY